MVPKDCSWDQALLVAHIGGAYVAAPDPKCGSGYIDMGPRVSVTKRRREGEEKERKRKTKSGPLVPFFYFLRPSYIVGSVPNDQGVVFAEFAADFDHVVRNKTHS